MLHMTIRQTIEQMRKVGTRTVVLNNGTEITIHEINADRCDYIGTIKWNETGNVKTIRRIFCSISSSSKTKGIEELQKKYWFNFFRDTDYCIPERAMNGFISENGGIDKYKTVTEPYYMMQDILLSADE